MKSYSVFCWYCSSEYDAAGATWCGHAEPTKICPFCYRCFCDAAEDYKEQFWRLCPDDLMEERLFSQELAQQKIGEMLLAQKKITQGQLKAALAEQNISHKRLGEVLVQMNLVSPEELQLYLLNQKRVEEVDLKTTEIDPSLIVRIGRDVCREFQVIPLELQDLKARQVLRLAVGSLEGWQQIKMAPPFKSYSVIPYLADKEDIRERLASLEAEEVPADLLPTMKNAEAIEFFNGVLKKAVMNGYSDIIFEFKEGRLRIFYQHRNRLLPVLNPQLDTHSLFGVIKKIAGLKEEVGDMPLKSVVQLSQTFSHVQVRVFYFPGPHEEIIRMRVINLNNLKGGFSGQAWDGGELELVRLQLKKTEGLYLVAGSDPNRLHELLYSLMHDLSPQAVASVETMVLARDPHFFQIEKEEHEIGRSILDGLLFHHPQSLFLFDFFDKHFDPEFLDFANAGRLFLELRALSYEELFDRLLSECEIPFAFLTRHMRLLIFSREINILCPHCKEKDPEGMAGRFPNLGFTRDYQLFIEKGCEKCDGTGYGASRLLGEVFALKDQERDAFSGEDLARLSARISEQGNLTIQQKAMNLVLRGEVSYREYRRFF